MTDEGLKIVSARTQIEKLDLTCCQKLSLDGIVAGVRTPPLRLLAVGNLFVPENLIRGVGLIRSRVGIYPLRPKLFSEMQHVAVPAGTSSHPRSTGPEKGPGKGE